MSVGDAFLDEEGNLYIVVSDGFENVEPSYVEYRAELALHMLRCGLTDTPGWHRLFREEGGAVARVMLEQLRQGCSVDVPTPGGTTGATGSEAAYQKHLRLEGPGPVNDHPDGCWFCGSTLHMSSDCPERDEPL